MKRIVLTGGPGAGKTVVSRAIVERDPARYVLVPEAATQVYGMLQTRWDRLDLEGRRDVQRRIYRHQVAQEDQLAADHPNQLILLDRGTIDGAAYWPDGPDGYFPDLGTTLEQQLTRYDAVIWLQTGAALGHYDGDASNACRFEDDAAAIESGLLLSRLWGGHSCIRHVGAYPTIGAKIEAVRAVIDELTQGKSE